MSHVRTRLGLVAAALCLSAYPALRPYGPEVGSQGAADFADPLWLVSHALGMSGFVLVALSLRGAAPAPPWPWSARSVHRTETWAWLAVALLLPYYGAEAYGLHEIGRYAVRTGEPGVLDVADAFRYAPLEVTTFTLGLLALAVVGVRLARGLWSGGRAARVGGLLAGLALATYLPQFFGPPAVRVGHGLVLGAGLLLVAYACQVRSQMVCGEESSFSRASGESTSTSVTT